MTSYDLHGASAESLERLMPLAPDPDRTERVRVRCRTRIGRSRRRTARTAVITGFTWRLLAPVVRRQVQRAPQRLLSPLRRRVGGDDASRPGRLPLVVRGGA